MIEDDFDHRDIPDVAAFVIDRKGHIVGWNAGAANLIGLAAVRVIGRECHQVLCGPDPEGRQMCHPWCAQARGNGNWDPDDDVVLYPRSDDGGLMRITLSVFRLGGADGTPAWIVHEITSARQIRPTLRVAWFASANWNLKRFMRKPKPPETSQH